MPLSSQKLAEIRGRLQPLLDAERRAAELEGDVPAAKLFLGVCGIGLGFKQREVFDGLITLRRVTNPPGVVHVARAANLERVDYLGVSRYSFGIAAELAVGNADSSEDDGHFLLGIAWHTVALIKLRGHVSVFCPAAATSSWDTVASISDNSVTFLLLDDVPRRIGLDHRPSEVSVTDVEWVGKYWDCALDLRGRDVSRRFGLAFNLAYVWNYTSDPRIALTNLWCGLEALFGQRTDRPVTERLVERICSWLPSATESETRGLYDRRCDAVHGRWIDDAGIREAIGGSESLLRQAVIRCVESRSVPLPDWT